MNQGPLPRGPFEEPSEAVQRPDHKAELAGRVLDLARYRKYTETVRNAGTILHEELAATDLGRRIARTAAALGEMKQAVRDAESEVRSLALQIHAETAERKPHPAVQIKQFAVPTITDEKTLLDHVRIHIPKCVRLDWRAVTKVAKVIELPGIVVVKEFRTTISRDLTNWLPVIDQDLLDYRTQISQRNDNEPEQD